jgi:hypothetical protein
MTKLTIEGGPSMRTNTIGIMAAALVALAGCGDAPGGTASGPRGHVQIFVAAEETIPEGLEPGTGEENIADGWKVEYDEFLVVIGNFRASRSADASQALSAPKVYIVDMKALPAGGLVLADLEAEAVRWDRFGFDLAHARAGMEKAPGLSQADHDLMVGGGYSVYVAGTLTRSDGMSCLPSRPTDCRPASTIRFAWGLAAGTSFDDCAPEMGDAGFAIPAGGAVQIKPTIHGDHWFFSNITQGEEITKRYAQWIANADLDRDGETTLEELRMSRASDLFPADEFNLSGATIPIETGYDYLEAQARTLGDYQGDGECPTRRALQ